MRTSTRTPPAQRAGIGDTVLAVRGLRIIVVGRVSSVVEDTPGSWSVVVDGKSYGDLRWIANGPFNIWAVPNEKGTALKEL